MSAAFSNTRSPPPEDKKPGLVPLGVRGEESDGGGGEGVRSDLSKMLQDLESEGGSEGEEPPHKRGDRRPFPPTSSSSSVPKKKKFTSEHTHTPHAHTHTVMRDYTVLCFIFYI